MGLLCGLFFVIIFLIVLNFVGAVLLRVACAICQVESPTMLKSMGIVLAVFIGDTVVRLGVSLMIAGMFGKSASAGGAPLVSTPLCMIAEATIYMLLIPTSFYRGILIWILWYIVLAVIVVVLLIAFFTVIASLS